MSDPETDQDELLTPDDVATSTALDAEVSGEVSAEASPPGSDQAISEPGKVMRIGSMVKQLLEEVRDAELDERSRERLAEVYERSVTELGSALSSDLQSELHGLALPFGDDEVPSEAELRVAKAQLVGWLEGLFHGIQASLMAQQFAAQQQLQQMRELPGQPPGPGTDERGRPGQPPQTGTYL